MRRADPFSRDATGKPDLVGEGSAFAGEWRLERTSGLLPPLGPVRKLIDGGRGWTLLGAVSVPFDLVGNELRYRFPFTGLVDVLTPDGPDAAVGRATVFGRQYGTFRMKRSA